MNVELHLRNCGVEFEVLPHRTEYTAAHTAQALHVPGGHFAKTVVLKVDDRPVLAVIPSHRMVNMQLVGRELKAAAVQLAREEELLELFPDCELGAIPPFGSEYEMETIVDEELTWDDHIIFEGNTHHRAIGMDSRDYVRIEHPHIAHIAC